MSDIEDVNDDRPAFAQDEAESLDRLLAEMGSLVASRSAAAKNRSRWVVSVSLAAAAIIALILLPARETRGPASLPTTASTADLEVESPDRFAVFSTGNPDIAVIWLFKEQE